MVREGSDTLNEFSAIEDVLSRATETLRPLSDSPRLDAELLLCVALDVARSYLFAHPDDVLDEAAQDRFTALLERRRQGAPMAYISGEKEFWSLTLMVSPATLVPRPETETLVERALREIPRDAAWKILDLGTGCGAIALAIAQERPLCDVTATDISGEALAVARQNARQLDLPNVQFLQGDWTDPVSDGQFDLIVSNPPYVRAADPALEQLACEPREALESGAEGLDAIRQLARDCRPLLSPGGVFMLEHGDDQAEAVAAILEDAGWTFGECLCDLAGKPRVSVAVRSA
jgi:release factor glutamine methyltransferase